MMNIEVTDQDLLEVVKDQAYQIAQMQVKLQATLRLVTSLQARLDELNLATPEGAKLLGFVEEDAPNKNGSVKAGKVK